MSSDFYMDSAVSAADMDPLGTAAAAQQTGTGTTGEPVIGQLKSSTGAAKKAKQPMSSKKKMAFIIGGVVAAAGVLTVLSGGQPPSPKMGHPPPVTAAEPGASGAGAIAGMVSAPAAGDSSTVMGSSEGQPAGAPQSSAIGTQPAAPMQAVQAPGPAQGAMQASVQPAPTMPAPPPATPAPAVASKPTAGTAMSASAAPVTNAGGWEQSKQMPDKSASAVPSSAENAKLVDRVAELERKLTKLGHSNENRAAPSQRSVASDVAPTSHRAKVQRLARAMATAPSTPVLRPTPTTNLGGSAQSGQVASLDNVHVIGTTTRQGVISALLSMGSTNKRVTEGQLVPGLGTVSKIGTDAAGNPYAEINGVTYQ